MAGINDISAKSFDDLGLAPSKPEKKDGQALGQEQFFELMIAQMRNQDPLKPLESNEFMGQVAQFSTVSAVQSMERSVGTLAQSLQSSQALQASTLVGRDVLIAAANAPLSAGHGVKGGIDLPASTGNLSLEITDRAGHIVKHMDLGTKEAGLVPFSWDGTTDDGKAAPEGLYTLAARGEFEGELQAIGTLINARVDSVTLDAQSPDLVLNLNGLGAVPLKSVREVF